MNTVQTKGSSFKDPDLETSPVSTKPSLSPQAKTNIPSPPSPLEYGLEDFKTEVKNVAQQAIKDAAANVERSWTERGHDTLNFGLFIWFLLVFYVPGFSTVNKFWKFVYYGATGAPTIVAKAQETVDKLAPKVDNPIKEKEMIGDCIMVTSERKPNRTVTVNGKTVTRPHKGWDFAPTFACYDKTPDNQENQIHSLYAVGNKGDQIKVSCTPPEKSGGYGWLAIVENKTQGFGLKYGHLQKGVLNQGTTCTAREFKIGDSNNFVGLMGSTGHSTGIHLHAEIFDLSTGREWDKFPRWMAYQIFNEPYDPLVQRGEKK